MRLSEAEKQQLKEKLPDYLAKFAIQLNPKKPIRCINPVHDDKHASMSYEPNANFLYCFSCQASYDIFSACEQLEGLQKGQGLMRIASMYGLRQLPQYTQPSNDNSVLTANSQNNMQPSQLHEPPPAKLVKDFSLDVNQWHAQLDFYEYHNKRGISDETAQAFALGYAPMPYTDDVALVIPMQRYDGTYSYQLRNTNPEAPKERRHYKPSKDEAGEAPLFNWQAIDKADKILIVVEGAMDALSFAEVGANAVALNGVGNIAKLVTLLSNNKKKLAIISALDNDQAGVTATQALRKALNAIKRPMYTVNYYAGNNDANEALNANRERFKRIVDSVTDEASAKATEYRQQTVTKDLSDFINQVGTTRPPALSTGFKRLDDILNGGLREGLIVIGGVSSLGKTTLAMQIMDNIAKLKKSVLIFSLEMSQQELRAKSIARESLSIAQNNFGFSSYAVTGLQVLDKEQREQLPPEARETFKNAANYYLTNYAQHVFIQESVGRVTVLDVVERVKLHTEKMGEPPAAILVDYLQILQPAENGLTDKGKVDFDILTLKQLSRDYHIPVLVVSAFNRASYKEQANFASFKESGAIEYSADLLLGLQLTATRTGTKLDEALAESPRQIDIKILKNRNGTLGLSSINAYLAYNFFEEMTSDELAAISREIELQDGTLNTNAGKNRINRRSS